MAESSLSDHDQKIIERLSESVTSGAPLAVGLRSAASEEPGSALSRGLLSIAKRLEQGDSLDAALASQLGRKNAHVPPAIRAGVKTGQLAQVLTELLRHQRFQRRLRNSFWISLAYPIVLIAFLAFMLAFVFTAILPMFRTSFIDFGLTLPQPTKLLLSFHEVDFRGTLVGLWLIPIGAILLRVLLGRANWRLFVSKMPFFGQLMHWNGVAQFARLLPIFLRQKVPIAEALELTSTGIQDANIALATRRLATKVQAGGTLASLVTDNHRLPQSAAVIIRWGEEHNQLPEALEMLADFGETRIERRAAWLATVLPPLISILIAVTIVGVFFAIFAPLLALISQLG